MNLDYNVTPDIIREKFDERIKYVLKRKNQGVMEADDGFADLCHELNHLLVSYFDTPFHRLQENELVNTLSASEILASMRIAYELNRNGFLSIPDIGEKIVKTADQMYDDFIEEYNVLSYKQKKCKRIEDDE